MRPVTLLLQRPSAFQGLGLIATSSALIGPLCLEVVFNHSDLWFVNNQWQDQALRIIWLSWTSLGIMVSCAWGLDRGFNGLTPEIHRVYSLILSYIGVLVYIIFGIPIWVWLCTMSLAQVSDMVVGVGFSLLILMTAATAASLCESKLSSLLGLLTGLSLGALLLWFGWGLWS